MGDDLSAVTALAKRVDVVVVVIGNHPTCGAGWRSVRWRAMGKRLIDRKSLTLEQEEIAKAALAGNPKTVVVLQASFPYTTNWTQEHVPAILEMTHNSEEQGDGLADVLFGDYDPAGRLTQTWVRDEADLPRDDGLQHSRWADVYVCEAEAAVCVWVWVELYELCVFASAGECADAEGRGDGDGECRGEEYGRARGR